LLLKNSFLSLKENGIEDEVLPQVK
jgi:hypothetical protein